jgi:uncharacterized protein YraI
MRLRGIFAAALLLTAPTAVLAAPGMVTTTVSLKAGPGAGFPVVDRIPAGARINVHGCIRGGSWCDVSWDGERGWVSARYLEYYFRNRYVYLPDYYETADVPVVPFVLGTYWSSYYSGRPWYRRHAYWNNYWNSQARFATQAPIGRGGREVETRTRTAVTPGQQGVVGGRGTEVRTGRFAGHNLTHGNVAGQEGLRRDLRETRQPIAGGREGRVEGNRFGGNRIEGRHFEGRNFEAHRFSGAPGGHPAPGPVAQPNVGRPGGAPFAAHVQQPSPPAAARAQMGGPHPMGGAPNVRPMGGAPNAGGGGAPHVSAAPHVGGGPAGGHPGGGGPNHPR